MKVKLRNNRNKVITTKVYVTEGQRESLLGKDDATSLGILKIDKDGDPPEEEQKVRCITPEPLKEPIKEGIVSGGQTQAEIDASMDAIAKEYAEIFEGMGRADVEPIHIQMKEGAIPVTQPILL